MVDEDSDDSFNTHVVPDGESGLVNGIPLHSSVESRSVSKRLR